jgi:hypothetical protein
MSSDKYVEVDVLWEQIIYEKYICSVHVNRVMKIIYLQYLYSNCHLTVDYSLGRGGGGGGRSDPLIWTEKNDQGVTDDRNPASQSRSIVQQ